VDKIRAHPVPVVDIFRKPLRFHGFFAIMIVACPVFFLFAKEIYPQNVNNM